MLLHMAETSAYVPGDLMDVGSFCYKSSSEGIIFWIYPFIYLFLISKALII